MFLKLLIALGSVAISPLEGAISQVEANDIAKRIYFNECSSNPDKLISWNDGEEFLSLGIGHFIWYSNDYKGPFTETFPTLAVSLKKQGVKVPQWIAGPCPWNSKTAFLQADPKQIEELRTFLLETQPQQAAFMADRLQGVLNKLLVAADKKSASVVQANFNALINAPKGHYVLIDYLNFKGEGISPNERYKGEGWGLLQVLIEMQNEKRSKNPVADFVAAAKAVLQRRVANSPEARNEAKWLPGWCIRLEGYLS